MAVVPATTAKEVVALVAGGRGSKGKWATMVAQWRGRGDGGEELEGGQLAMALAVVVAARETGRRLIV